MNHTHSPPPEGVANFQPTHWTLVLAAAQSRAPGASSALARLCQLYWYPLYAFARRRGHVPEDAQDLTQGFFLQLLEHRLLAAADQRKGKFRSFLLAAFQHYLSDQADRARCLKRGGRYEFISLDLENAEDRYQREPAGTDLTAEQLFDARWAIVLLGRAKTLLGQEYEVQGRAAIFDALKPFLEGGAPTPSYEAAANALGMGLATTKTLIHRLRKRYTAILRQEIARTVSDPGEVGAEIHALCGALIASEGRLEP
ncbi:MAG: sigma-70 family RNA polymerase sigma factor [Verrucomicrobia bacterium]|nr:sigma-70 family RNA polymerase sigma factor [Verrucomicrobiota bacterium]